MSASAAVLFDLDGTLLDTLADLAGAMNAALTGAGEETHPVEAYRYMVGDGMEMLARRALGNVPATDPRVPRCMAAMDREYAVRWDQSTRPYPGVPELLNALTRHGIPMAVFSNKPDAFTQLTVSRLLAAWRFQLVRGARDGFPRKPDPSGALAVAAELKWEPAQVLYLGDTNTDMQTARAAGMRAVGATWGFRPAAELKAAGAEILVDHPRDVLAAMKLDGAAGAVPTQQGD